MALQGLFSRFSDLRRRSGVDTCASAEPQEERKTMDVPQPRPRRRKPLDAGPFQPEIGSFRLHLAAQGKAAKTVRTYTEAVQWFAAAHLIPRTGCTRWDQVQGHDVRRWMVWLLGLYSDAYASNQYRALQQFFKWLAEEDELPDPMARLHPPTVTEKLVPVFTSEELSKLEKACQGRSFAQRRDAAIIAVFTATGIRAAELAGIRYDAHDPRASDVDLWQREITVRGKGGKVRVVKITHDAARVLDRYIRVRARHAQAWRRPLWLGVNNRGPLTSNGIYQMIARRGRECGVAVHPHRFRHHFSHTWLDRGGAEADLMELNGWSSPQMLRRYGASARSARARRSYDRIMDMP
jgi:site-specific recombinase XerD